MFERIFQSRRNRVMYAVLRRPGAVFVVKRWDAEQDKLTTVRIYADSLFEGAAQGNPHHPVMICDDPKDRAMEEARVLAFAEQR